MARGRTRYVPDSHTLAAYGGLLLGCIAGAGFAVAAMMQFAPDLGGTCQLTRLDSPAGRRRARRADLIPVNCDKQGD